MYTNRISSRRDMVLSGLALSLASIPVTAQTADESVEEVVVLGSYAQSLKSALDRKRNADGVVDAITAEDIGKYPDTQCKPFPNANNSKQSILFLTQFR